MNKLFKSKLTLFLTIILSIILVAGCGISKGISSSKANDATEAEKPANTEKVKEAQKLEQLAVQGPMGISIAAPIFKLVDDNKLTDYTNELSYLPWKNPDELRARISSGQVDVSAVPTYVGANLYNRGMDVKLVNTLIWGILYVIGPDGEKVSWEQLKGETVYVPFKGDMPDLVFQYLLNKNNINSKNDLKIEYVSSPQEIVKLLIAGKAKYAVLPEHVATLSLLKGKQEGINLTKVMSLQEEWAKATGREPLIPQAGILVSAKLISEHPGLVDEMQKQLEEGIQFINDNPSEAAKIIQKYNEDVPVQVIEKVIPSLNLKFVSAKDAKEDLKFFFKELSTLSPEIIGGKLPDENFYYEK